MSRRSSPVQKSRSTADTPPFESSSVMTLHWLRLDAQGTSRLAPLPALAMHYQGPVDAEGYRRRARGEEPQVAHRFSTSGGVRTICLNPDQSADILGPPARRLTLIVSGEVILRSEEHT